MGQRQQRQRQRPRTREVVEGGRVGIDPHKKTLSAAIIDGRGLIVAVEHFKVSGDGHRQLEAWAGQYGPIVSWGVEGVGSWGRHTAQFLVGHGHDVRDVCPHRTNQRDRARQRGKSDELDCERIARELLAHPDLPLAFKRDHASRDRGPDQTHELMALWHAQRRSVLASRQHLLNEAESLLVALPLELQARLPRTKDVRARLRALADRDRALDPAGAADALRLELLDRHRRQIAALDADEKHIVGRLGELTAATGSTLPRLIGLNIRSTAELLIETGDPRRFTDGGFGKFSGTAPIPASTGDAGDPVRHRLNRGGNRRINSILHIMAITQLRHHPPARELYDCARARGKTRREALRILKRHLARVVHRTMLADLARSYEHATHA
jgi:transposase